MMISRRTAVGLVSAAIVVGYVGSASAADTIKFGMTTPMTGPAALDGDQQTKAAKLAVQEINAAGGVLGKQLEMVQEDDQTTNPGIVLAFSRLISRGDLSFVIASVRSTQVNAISADVQKSALPVFFGGTDPTLTKNGNPWLFRTRPNDSYSAKVIADFGVNEQKKKKWAIIHGTDAFGINGMKALTEALKALNIEPVLVQGFPNGQTDLTPVVLAVRQSGADIMSSYIAMENDVGVLARQLRQLGVNIPWVGSASVSAVTSRTLAGPALYGTYSVSDFNKAASPEAKKYFEDFSKAYNKSPDHLSAWVYDAIHVAAVAIKKAGSTDPEKMRQAVLSINNIQGAEGSYDFDQNGDGLRGYNIIQNVNGEVNFVRHIKFNK